MLLSQILIDIFCLKWTSHRIAHFRLQLSYDIGVRNPFLQNKSTIVYISLFISIILFQELPGGYGRIKPDIVTYGSAVRGSALKYVLA